VLKDRGTKRSSDFNNSLEEKGIEECKLAKKGTKADKKPIFIHRMSGNNKIERNE